jgi:hypothetical protein
MTITLEKVRAGTAAEICDQFDVSEESRALLRPGARPGDHLGALLDAGQTLDALQFLAFCLPPREAVWWACVCVRSELGPDTPPAAVAALQAAEAWAFQPTEQLRQDAGAAAEPTEMQFPASWAGMAAFWSGGSMVNPEFPVVPPKPNLTPMGVFAAVATSGFDQGAEVCDERYREYLARGIDLANGGTGHI